MRGVLPLLILLVWLVRYQLVINHFPLLFFELLIYFSHSLRANDVAVRRRYVKLIEDVKEYGGDVK